MGIYRKGRRQQGCPRNKNSLPYIKQFKNLISHVVVVVVNVNNNNNNNDDLYQNSWNKCNIL